MVLLVIKYLKIQAQLLELLQPRLLSARDKYIHLGQKLLFVYSSL
jgi:hypothetical protein